MRVAGLTKVYRGVPVLDGVDLELRAGEVVGIIGPGGEGKSRLRPHLPRLLGPDGGRVEIDGQDLARLDARALAHVRERFGYVFQNYALFDFMTVGDNVAFPLRQLGPVQRPREADIEARVRARLADVGLAHAFSQYPRELSGGMKKRVGLARATIADPEIALYDDPSAGLDPVTSSKIFALIEAMHARVPDATTVVVSHDIDRMRAICHRWVMIAQGRVVFDGTDEALADAAPAVRAFVFGAAGASSDARRAGARA
ncbi:MAG: ATP-binding cassette domain-containing protein [Deltaproteobacteria bacterium]|nr:ATP-binding cassette domain-containing protein [Deltaproteobacteria bacterium]